MKTSVNYGFSLVELLVVTAIASILISIAINTHSLSKTKTQAELDRQSLLHIPISLENYFSRHYHYPNGLSDILTDTNGEYFTPRKFYLINYQLNDDDSYTITAILNSNKNYSEKIICANLSINSAGHLSGRDISDNDISNQCWRQ